METQSELNEAGQPKTESELWDEEVRRMAGLRALLEAECPPAAVEGVAALKRIVKRIVGQDYGAAIRLRDFLRSLGLARARKVNLSEISYLDWENRKDLAAVILGIHQPGFPDHLIREAFKEAGDFEARWFLGAKARRTRILKIGGNTRF